MNAADLQLLRGLVVRHGKAEVILELQRLEEEFRRTLHRNTPRFKQLKSRGTTWVLQEEDIWAQP